MMKKKSRRRLAAALLLTLLVSAGCVTLLLERGYPRTGGTLTGLPISAPVTIRRDSFGIPHIAAQNEADLYFAQGYAHAQDRLFQMEMVRRLVSGTLSEALGRRTLDLDTFARLAGFPDLRRRAAAALGERERELAAAYVAGINSYLAACGPDLPLEFRLLRLRPRPWSVEEILSNFVLFSWGLATNYSQELLALQTGASLPLARWNELFPACPGSTLPPDRYFDDLRLAATGRLLPAAFAFLVPSPLLPGSGGGSNAWAVAAGANGRPVLANDPHLAVAVPQFWYFCHLRAPGLNVAGASVAGTPGVLIGRNPDLAWGLTNLMTDYVDLFVVRLDPQDPQRYIADGQVRSLSEESLSIPVGRRRRATRTVVRTCYGPVISRLGAGEETAVVLKWYGTLPPGVLEDHSLASLLAINRAGSVDEALAAADGVALLGLNLVAADRGGHIGWRAVGAVPLRRGYSGRLPADGSAGGTSGGMDWTGFLAPGALPRLIDPPAGRLANANQRPFLPEGCPAISHSWCPPYRCLRIESMLDELIAPGAEDFRLLQQDVLSLQASRLLPRMLAYNYRDPRALEAAALLAAWDCRVEADSPAAALWELFLVAWMRLLVEDDLGKHSAAFLDLTALFYSLPDEILFHPDSPFWDRLDTPRREESREILELALAQALTELEKRLGADRAAWRWGDLHPHAYQHPASALGLLARRLNRGAYSAGGDAVTVQATAFLPGRKGFRVVWHPSMRLVTDLGSDTVLLMGPMGQSGQPGHAHYDDMIGPWQRGELVPLGLDDRDLEAPSADTLVLLP
jgi:penicillin amidase